MDFPSLQIGCEQLDGLGLCGSAPQGAGSPLAPTAGARRPSIAIVDDNCSVRRSIALIMQCLDLDVRAFASGEDLLASEAPEQSDCILLDLLMPTMTGLEVLEALGARGCAAPVIVMTGDDDPALERAARALGACAYVLKPFEIGAIASIVSPLIRGALHLAA